ncbi:MAG: DUF6198 family protein [Bacteroidales bacterium]
MFKNKLLLRVATFGVGLFVMAFGVALSVKASMGVSPISCIPYVYSFKAPYTLGELTIVFNILLIIVQIGILRKKYRIVQLVQLPVVFCFGVFIDMSLNIVSHIDVLNYAWQAFWCLLSCIVIAFGVFLEVKANITYLPGEGVALAIAETFNKEFGKAKIGVDSSMVILGIISSFVFLHKLQGIREGTIAAAILVGFIVRFYSKRLSVIEKWLTINIQEVVPTSVADYSKRNLIITISREYGSGGHEIGKRLADKLGVSFYDKNLIELTAEQSGFTADYIQQNEQKLAHSLLFQLYQQNYAYVNEEQPPLDILFLVQSKIIRDISTKESCVIVGRCANFVLKGSPNCINIFIHADRAFRKNKISEEYGIHAEVSDDELDRIDRERANYCLHFTGEDWHNAAKYDLTINSACYNTDKIVEMIISLIDGFHFVSE